MHLNRTIRAFLTATALGVVTATALSLGAAGSTLGPTDGAGLPPTDLERVKPGVQAPDFTLEDQNGRPVMLSAFRDQRPVVLVFYRGHW
jgi:cytochrome oxidase Cu insertion factor (SCO1/SenC/PrrC family)